MRGEARNGMIDGYIKELKKWYYFAYVNGIAHPSMIGATIVHPEVLAPAERLPTLSYPKQKRPFQITLITFAQLPAR